MWRCRADATTRKSTPTTEPTLHRDLSATFPTDRRWKRVVNPRRTRSNRLPHQAKRTNLPKQKVTASADSPGHALQHPVRGDVSYPSPCRRHGSSRSPARGGNRLARPPEGLKELYSLALRGSTATA